MAVPVYADSHTHEGWTAWNTANALPTEAGNYYLTTDVTVKGAQHNAWSAPAGTTSICLEGHTIKYAGSTNGNVMRVYSGSTLHIYDKDDNSGKITGGAATWYYNGFDHFGNGGGVFVDGGTFYLHGGQITGNGAVAGGGVSVMHDGYFYMSGGIISNNTADDSNWFRAAGVQVESGSTFTMTGGTITANHGDYNARRWGVFVNGEGTINVSGSPVITGNQGELNLLLGDNRTINVIGPLTENALIGVTTWSRVSESENNPTRITSGLSENGDLSNFVCDNGNWYKDPPANNYLRLTGGDAEIYYAVPHNVTVTPGSNMTKTSDSGAESQTSLTGAMTDVVYTADEGYYFPADYAVDAVNGISVTRNGYTQITVSGTPTADATITLTAPTAKTKMDTPAASFAAGGESSGVLTISNAGAYTLAYKDSNGGDVPTNITQEGSQSWPIADIGPCTMTVIRVPNPSDEAESATKLNSDAQTITITKADAPSIGKTDCTTEANNDGTITGVDTTMEYQANGASDWTEVSGISITGLTAGTYHVRVKAAGTVLASEPVDVTIAKYEAPFVPEYTIIVTNDSNGTASASIEQGEEGTEVTLTATPSEGYQFKEWQVVSGGVTVTENKFTIGTENVEVKAIFEEIPTEPTQVATPVLPASKSFTDSMTITITCETEGAAIYYTTGGAITLYEGAFNITETTTVEAYARKDGLDESEHTTATYTKTDPTSSTGGGGTTTYPVKPASAENGNVTVAPRNAAEKATVTVTVTPDEGYVLDKLTVKDKNGKEIEVKDNGDGTYTFTMPASAIEIEATFKPDAGAAADDFPFIDVPENSYFRKPVEWAVEKGITNGVSEDKYGPEMSCTRAQVVTFLWITCGSEDAGTETGFNDVDVDAYYDKAVAWAVEKGITAGTSEGEFSPDMTVTRAQFVTMLWVANGKPEVDGEMPFLDVPSDAYYAKAVAWAYANDITAGKSADSFAPDDPCTRAQIMTFLYNAYAE